MSEHTPTPWQIYDIADPHHIMIKGIYPVLGGAHVADVLFYDNAAFIVKAVNSHDALVKALEGALKELEYIAVKHGYVTTETVIVMVRETLKKAS